MDDTVPAPPWLTPPKPAVARVALTRDAIVEAALSVLDREGADGLSMRNVAKELGAAAASLYGHVANKEELIQLVLDRVIGEVPPPEPRPAGEWQEQTKEFMRGARAAFKRHPGSAALSLGRIPVGPSSIVQMEAMLDVTGRAGLPDLVRAYAGDLLGLYVGAFAYEESLAAGEMDEQLEQFRAWLMSLPPDRFPNFVALAPAMTWGGPDERFEWGLEVIVRGLASYASESSEPPPPSG